MGKIRADARAGWVFWFIKKNFTTEGGREITEKLQLSHADPLDRIKKCQRHFLIRSRAVEQIKLRLICSSFFFAPRRTSALN